MASSSTKPAAKTAPASIAKVQMNANGIYVATDADGDWVLNHAAIAALQMVVHNYSRMEVRFMASALPVPVRKAIVEEMLAEKTVMLRCETLGAYLIAGSRAAELITQINAGKDKEAKELIALFDRWVGAAEAQVAADGRWTNLAFVTGDGSVPGALRVVV